MEHAIALLSSSRLCTGTKPLRVLLHQSRTAVSERSERISKLDSVRDSFSAGEGGTVVDSHQDQFVKGLTCFRARILKPLEGVSQLNCRAREVFFKAAFIRL